MAPLGQLYGLEDSVLSVTIEKGALMVQSGTLATTLWSGGLCGITSGGDSDWWGHFVGGACVGGAGWAWFGVGVVSPGPSPWGLFEHLPRPRLLQLAAPLGRDLVQADAVVAGPGRGEKGGEGK